MPATMRPRTIQFYEIMEIRGVEQFRMEQQGWPSMLSALAGADLASRTWDGPDRKIIGQAYKHEDEDRLLLHKVRGPGDWLSRVDYSTENIELLEEGAGSGYLDSTAVHFVGFGNVVALMQGSTSAPSHKTLSDYLNHLNPFGSENLLSARPLVTHAEMERLKQASQVGRIDLKLGTKHLQALKGKQGGLAKWLRSSKRFGDVNVQVIISVPRGKQNSEQRIALAEQLNDISDVIPGAAQAAKATLYYGAEDALSSGRVAELVEHNITAKVNVPAVDSEGNSIRFRGAFTQMDSAVYDLSDELRAAADAE